MGAANRQRVPQHQITPAPAYRPAPVAPVAAASLTEGRVLLGPPVQAVPSLSPSDGLPCDELEAEELQPSIPQRTGSIDARTLAQNLSRPPISAWHSARSPGTRS